MKRELANYSIQELRSLFPAIEFPQYQREPNVWSRHQKQRLIDSILRQFDIASIYLYERSNSVYECIDGRQRLNAIMSFIGENLEDSDNGFPLLIDSEISSVATEYSTLQGQTFRDLDARTDALAIQAVAAFVDYSVSVTRLSDSDSADQFNLQFLRLNLGTMVNAGEKLHAMVGTMRDLVFDSELLGQNPFFDNVEIPTRRYAKEQVAAQVALQAFAYATSEGFTRGRYIDLQKFLKEQANVKVDSALIKLLSEVLRELNRDFDLQGYSLRSRAIAVSVVLLGFSVKFKDPRTDLETLVEFTIEFSRRLQLQVERLKAFDPDHDYEYLIEFQRHVTQASVERFAVSKRHEILSSTYDFWQRSGRLPTTGEI